MNDIARRWFIEQCGIGLGAIALTSLWSADSRGSLADEALDALTIKPPHHAPKAKNVILLFMGGGPSQFELFDYKPTLERLDGTLPPADLLDGYRAAFINPHSTLLGPKFKFARHGQSGAELSELLPHTARVVDDLCIIRSLTTDAFNHAPAQLLMSTGSQQFGRPSMGTWVTYALGSPSRDLPAYVVLNSGQKGPSAGSGNWHSGFLPTVYSGVEFRSSGDPVLYLSNPAGVDRQLQATRWMRLEPSIVADWKPLATRKSPAASRPMKWLIACSSAPRVVSLDEEPNEVLELYGVDRGQPSFAYNCLLARRLVQNGVRFVQLFHESWDQHGGLRADLKNCLNTDQACAALVSDLKRWACSTKR